MKNIVLVGIVLFLFVGLGSTWRAPQITSPLPTATTTPESQEIPVATTSVSVPVPAPVVIKSTPKPKPPTPSPVICTADAKICPDGSGVGRIGPKCEFAECPKPKPSSSNSTGELGKVVVRNGVSITPLEILEDSRCPSDVTCIQAGTVRLRAKLAVGSASEESVLKLGEAVTFRGKLVTLSKVSSGTISTHAITPDEYRFEYSVANEVVVPAPTSSSAPVIPIADLELRIHALINIERANQGLSVLAWQPALLPIARAHSADMATRGYFEHDSPEGENFSGRYKRGGFECKVQIGNTIYLGAENLYQNNLYSSWHEINGVRTYDYNTLEEIAATTVAGWMKSPGHRQNILTPHWQTEAIGIVFATNDQVLITQNFC